MIRGLLKWIGVLLLCVGAVWLCVIGYWFVTHANPSARDLGLYLVALPCTVFVAFIAGRAIWNARRPADAEDESDAASAPAVAQTVIEDRRYLLVGTALRLPAGDDAASVLAILRDGKTRPGLDDRLVDDAGLPVFASRVAALDDDACGTETLGLPTSPEDEAAPMEWPLYQRRAIALLDQSLAELVEDTLVPTLDRLDQPADETAPDDDASQSAPTIDGLRVFLVTPDHRLWPEATMQSLASHYRAQLPTLIGKDCPTIAVEWLDPNQPVPTVSTLDNWLVRLSHGDRTELAIVLALHSDIDPDRVVALDEAGQLFSQANPEGRTPSEGAAVLLIAPDALHDRFDAADVVVAHRAILGAREREIGSGGRETGHRLGQLLHEAIATADRPAQEIGCLISDSGIGTARGLEIGAILDHDAFEHLDSGADHLSLGRCCGELGGVATVAALALARQQSLDQSQAVVVLSTRDTLHRAAQLLGPPIDDTAPEDTNDDPQAASRDA